MLNVAEYNLTVLRVCWLRIWLRFEKFLIIFVFTPLFSVSPSFKVFQTVSLMHPPPALIRQTKLCCTQLTGLNKYQMGDFNSTSAAFYQKSVFYFWFPSETYQIILIYGIFSGLFLDNLEWLFYIKLWWQKKIFFLQMHNTILQRIK